MPRPSYSDCQYIGPISVGLPGHGPSVGRMRPTIDCSAASCRHIIWFDGRCVAQLEIPHPDRPRGNRSKILATAVYQGASKDPTRRQVSSQICRQSINFIWTGAKPPERSRALPFVEKEYVGCLTKLMATCSRTSISTHEACNGTVQTVQSEFKHLEDLVYHSYGSRHGP